MTDANLVLHRLDPAVLLGGRVTLDEQAARRAIAERIAAPLGIALEAAALGIIRIAVANMSRAIRSVSTEKGHDLGEFMLFPYGGAGPLHAVAVAAECNIGKVLVPLEPGTLCARGILLSDVSLDLVRSEITDATPQTWPRILDRIDAMQSTGRAWLDGEQIPLQRRRFVPVIEARYKGQNHEVQVSLNADVILQCAAFVQAFEQAHRREYGYDIPGRAIEVVNCRLKAIGLIDRPAPQFIGASGLPRAKTTRQVHFDTGWIATPIYDRDQIAIGERIAGPAVIDEMSATTLVPPDWQCTVDRSGNLLLEIVP